MGYFKDLREHLAALEEAGLLVKIDELINKDTELMPLVRWQFRGLSEEERRAFMFTNVTDVKGRKYDILSSSGLWLLRGKSTASGCNVNPKRSSIVGTKHRAIQSHRRSLTMLPSMKKFTGDRRSWTKGAWGNSRFPSRPRIRLRAVHYRLALVHPRSGNGPYQHRQLPRPYQKPDTNRCLSQFEQSRWISLAQVPGAGDPSSGRAGDRRAAAGILHGAGPHTVQRQRT